MEKKKKSIFSRILSRSSDKNKSPDKTMPTEKEDEESIQKEDDSTLSTQKTDDSPGSNAKESGSTEANQGQVDSAEENEKKDLSKESVQKKDDSKESVQKKDDSKESVQKVDSAESSQKGSESASASHKKEDTARSSKIDSEKSSLKKEDLVISRPKKDSKPPEIVHAATNSYTVGTQIKPTGSVRQFIVWTMTGFFDWNPNYFLQMRGLMNILHTVFSLTVLILLSMDCQLYIYPNTPSEGFFCKPPETFLFIISCCSFLTSIVYLFCCILSKTTDALMYQTSFEITYYILYFILLLTASITVIVSIINWGSDRAIYGNDYDSTQIAAMIGLLNSIMYGISAIWFFMSHRYFWGLESSSIIME